jgi:Flp pilus assembly protein TadG
MRFPHHLIRKRIGPGRLGHRGVAAVELALLAPILALMLAGAVDLGMGLYTALEVRNAAEAGGQYVALKGFDATAAANAVTNATLLSGVTATPAPAQMCGCPTATGITTIACSSSCPDGTSPGTYAKIYASNNYTPPIAFPGLDGPYSLQSHTMVRLQ